MSPGKYTMSPRERLMAVAVMASVFMATYYFGVKRQEGEITLRRSELEREEASLKERQTMVNELSAKTSPANAAKDDMYRKYLDSSRYFSNLLRKLGAEEGQNHFLLQTIDITENTKINSMYRSTLRLEVETSFIDLGNFLANLGQAEVLLDIKNIKLNRIDTDLKRCLAIIDVQGYYDGERE